MGHQKSTNHRVALMEDLRITCTCRCARASYYAKSASRCILHDIAIIALYRVLHLYVVLLVIFNYNISLARDATDLIPKSE